MYSLKNLLLLTCTLLVHALSYDFRSIWGVSIFPFVLNILILPNLYKWFICHAYVWTLKSTTVVLYSLQCCTLVFRFFFTMSSIVSSGVQQCIMWCHKVSLEQLFPSEMDLLQSMFSRKNGPILKNIYINDFQNVSHKR